jgi:hypothetical protein
MKIVIEENEIDRIASDDADGKFYLRTDGVILYIGPRELEPWKTARGQQREKDEKSNEREKGHPIFN